MGDGRGLGTDHCGPRIRTQTRDRPRRVADARLRLFFAIWPPAATAAALARWAAEAAVLTGGRAVRESAIHVTLAFLGEVSEERAAAAIRAARRVRAKPHALLLERAKLWARNRIVWVGPKEIPLQLGELAQSLRAELEKEHFALEDRPFAAHVTLIRNARNAAHLPLLPELHWPVGEFVLVRSRLSAKGSLYETVERFPQAI